MKLKIMINLKKFISVLLCSILISSTLPCNLLNTMVSAVELGPNDKQTNRIKELKDQAVAYIINNTIKDEREKNGIDHEVEYERLQKGTDYDVDYENCKIIFRYSYFKNLPQGIYQMEIYLNPSKDPDFLPNNMDEPIQIFITVNKKINKHLQMM